MRIDRKVVEAEERNKKVQESKTGGKLQGMREKQTSRGV